MRFVATTDGVERRVDMDGETYERAMTSPMRPGSLDRNALVDLALVRLGARRSAWNPADARGEVERLIATTGGVIDGVVRRGFAEDLTARVVAASRPLLGRTDVSEHCAC